MPTVFEFATATRIYFGAGALTGAGKWAAGFGKRVLIVTGADTSRAAPLTELLHAQHIEPLFFAVNGEPSITLAEAATDLARRETIEVVIGFGGGSAIDMGKAVAALAVHDSAPLDYLEVIGRGQPLTRPSLPYLAIPTTAGTGAEVTSNAVLSSSEQQVKVSLRSPYMLPRAAIVDPALTMSLPPDVTARTGMDALTQCLEPLVSNKANPLTDAIAREGIRRAARSLLNAYQTPDDAPAREDMAIASLFGGLSLSNAKLGAVHGFASPIGGMYDAPHGAICAALLAPVMRANLAALRARPHEDATPNKDAPARFDEVAQLLTGRPNASADDGAEWLAALTQLLDIPPLRAYGITDDALPTIAEKAAKASSIAGNPIKLTQVELIAILEAAM